MIMGSEFLSRKVSQLFRDGILHPQHNVIVERRHITLLNLAFVFQSGLPLKIWPYSILTSTQTINRIPYEELDQSAPYEIIFYLEKHQIMIKLSLLVVLLMYPTFHFLEVNLIQEVLSVFILGSDSCYKGYVLFDLDNSEVLISKHVKFVFDKFLFLYSSSPANSDPTLPYPAIQSSL